MNHNEDPLNYLSRKELLLNILKNIQIEINADCAIEKGDSSGNLELKHWWDNAQNWIKVKTFITDNTMRAGSTSARKMCQFLGINPSGKSFF